MYTFFVFRFYIKKIGFKNSGLTLAFWPLVGIGRSGVMIGSFCLNMVQNAPQESSYIPGHFFLIFSNISNSNFWVFLVSFKVLRVLESSGKLRGRFPPIFVKNAWWDSELWPKNKKKLRRLFFIGYVFPKKLGLDAGFSSWDLKNRIPREKLRI